MRRSVGDDVQSAETLIRPGRLHRLSSASEADRVGKLEPENFRAKAPLQLIGTPLGDDTAVIEQCDGVRKLVRLFQVLRCQENRDSFVHKLSDGLPKVFSTARVEPRRRLVQEEKARSLDHADGEVESALHATRVGAGTPVTGVSKIEGGQQLRRTSPCRPFWKTAEPSHHFEVLLPAEQIVDCHELAGETY